MVEIERSYSVAEIRQVDLRIALGDLTATAGSGDQIRLRASLRSNDETELETTVTDGVLLVKNRTDNGWLARNSSRIDVALTIPRDAAVVVTAKTGLGDGKGDVDLRTWRGDLHVTTGKGDVAVSDLNGGLQMVTGAGDTTVERWQADGGAAHEIKTGSGDVVLRDAQAQGLEVTTGRGDCVLRQVALRTLQAKTGYGNLTLEGDPPRASKRPPATAVSAASCLRSRRRGPARSASTAAAPLW